MASYIALIRKTEDSCFGIEFPEFPGCISAGDTMQEAHQNAEEALALHVQGLIEDDEPIPSPRSLEEISSTEDLTDAIPMLVQLKTLKGRAKRVNITIDEALLSRIDEVAPQYGLSRSGFLAEAARRVLMIPPESRRGR